MEAYYGGLEVTDIAKAFKLEWQLEAVSKCCDQMDEYIADLMSIHGEPEMHLEATRSLLYDETVFGTTDVTIFFPATSHLVIADYKFGMGEVMAEENEQLMVYAIAGLSAFPSVTSVEIAVVQPRVKKIESWITTPKALEDWANTVLYPAIEAAKDPNAARVPGAVQCEYCEYGRRKGCSEMANMALDLHSEIETVSGPMLNSVTTDELDTLAGYLPFFETACKVIGECITNRMLEGEVFENHKLVRKNTHLKWEDEEATDKFLARKKLTQEQRYTKKLITPSAAKKILGYPTLSSAEKKAIDKYIIKPEGEITFATRKDKRDEVIPEITVDVEVVEDLTLDMPEAVDVSSLF
jgi:hypothetical protein